MEEMHILNTQIPKGSYHELNIDIAKLYTGTKINVPVIVSRSKKPGPTLLITAGLHGDEVNGVEIVRQIIEKKLNIAEKGTIICIPLINVFGFLHKERYFPDGKDLNRMFPGTKKGSLASRFAYQLMHEIIPHADYILDFHTGGSERFNYTQLRIAEDAELEEISSKLNVPFVMYSKPRRKSFREGVTKLGKKVILFEGGKSHFLDKIVTKVGIEAACRLMDLLHIRKMDLENPSSPKILQKNRWIRASKAGLFRSMVKNGTIVEKGNILGTVSDPYGKKTLKIRAAENGHIICINHAPLVNQGDALFNIGIAYE